VSLGVINVAGTTPDAEEARMDPQQLTDQTDELVAEDLIEEVSIDGMCGVY
jgi:mycofactocin precursor